MNEGYTDKARAIFLAALMVLSIAGGSIAFAGSAAANTASMSLSDDLVQDGDDIYVNGTVNANGTVHAFIDEDDAGNYSSAEDTSGLEHIDNYEDDNSYSITLTAPSESGTYDVYVFQDESDTETEIDEDDEGERSASLQVDADKPTISDSEATPTGEVNDPNQEIAVPVSDETTDVETIQVELYHNGDQMGAYDLTPDNEPDGLAYADENLTINPGSGNIPALQDGTTTVYVTATDTAGNSKDASFSFEVETDSLETEFVADNEDGSNAAEETFSQGEDRNPFDSSNELNVYDENEYAVDFDVSLEAPAASLINDGTAELVIDGPGADGEVTFDNEADDVYTSGGTFSVNTDGDDYNFSADGTYSVTISGEDTAGNSIEETYDVKVDTTSPTAESIELSDTTITEADYDEQDTVTVTFDEPVDPATVEVELRVDGEVNTTVSKGIASLDYTDEVDIGFTPSDTSDPTVLNDIENGSAIANVTAAEDVANNALQTEGQNETTFEVYTQTPKITVEAPSPTLDDDFSGAVNFSTFVTEMDDDVEATYRIEDTENSNYIEISDSVENYDTNNLPDGTYNFVVDVEDEYGNTASDSAEFTIDNVVGTVEKVDTPNTLSDWVHLTESTDDSSDELFDYDGDGDTNALESGESFTISVAEYNETTAEFGNYQELNGEWIDTTNYEDGLIKLKATVHGAEGGSDSVTQVVDVDNIDSVQYESGPTPDLGTVALENANADKEVLPVIVSDHELETLGATVANLHYDQDSTTTLSIDDFTEVKQSNGEYRYTAPVQVDYDGQYELTVTDATYLDEQGDSEVWNGEDPTSTTLVDTEQPKPIEATVANGYEDQLTIEVLFSEPLDKKPETDEIGVEGVSTDVRRVDALNDESKSGVIFVTFDEEFQTADAPDITFDAGSLSDAFGSEYESNSDEVKTPIRTERFDLSSEGLNVISVPAETGRLDITETDFNSDEVEAVWAYAPDDPDAGENGWLEFAPGAEENSLDYLKGGEGYIVSTVSDTQISVNAQNAPVSGDRTQKSLNAGWNLIGHYQEGYQKVGQALTPLGDQVYQIENGYTGEQLTTDRNLKPGQGYWLFTSEGGLHVPVNYGGPTSEKPDVYAASGVNFIDSTIENGEEVTIKVAVDSDAALRSVTADNHDLGIDNGELKAVDSNLQEATLYEGTFDVDYQSDYDGIESEYINIRAVTTDGNVGEYGEKVDPADRSGSVSVNSNDLTPDSTVTFDVEYNDGVVDPALVIEKQNGDNLKTVDLSSAGEKTVTFNPQNLPEDDADLNAKLVDNSESGEYVVSDTDAGMASTTVSTPVMKDMAYYSTEGDWTVETGASAIANAEDSASAGTTIYVEENSEGTTYDGFSVSKTDLTLEGPNAGVAGDSDQRGSEATITSGVFVDGNPSDVVIDGFAIERTIGEAEGVVQIGSTSNPGANNLTIRNNVITATSDGPSNLGTILIEHIDGEIQIEDNLLTQTGDGTGEAQVRGLVEAVQLENTAIVVDGNTIETDVGVRPSGFDGPSPEYTITNNEFVENDRVGVQLGGSYNGEVEISGNTFEDSNIGIDHQTGATTDITIESNTFTETEGAGIVAFVSDRRGGDGSVVGLDRDAIEANNTFNPGSTQVGPIDFGGEQLFDIAPDNS
ncbi:cell surface glycoprotein [Halodesulfurarchaeum formicicum]|uniref:Cell surface glycoprotein n=2 Tax=Halodesulfurarchaeum formicicum TaxID=1873524 RepID=A0A1J1AE69_9EURY|nr:cell surface glycoprotein [Halodesulfurarchaeum formicicum]